MRQLQRKRTRAIIEAELERASQHRRHAVVFLDFEAYQNLTEQIDDLLEELGRLLPEQRGTE